MVKPVANDIDRQIGLRLKKLRKQEGISAALLAEAIGSTQQQISRYENGQNKLSAAQLYLLSQSLNVPVSWFFLDCETQPTPLLVREKTPHYGRASLSDETDILNAMWPRIQSAQRVAVIKLLDSFGI